MSRLVRVSREELERMISILTEIESRRLDPFSVDVSSLLKRLRDIIERERDIETIALDAETLYRVSVVLGLQQRWIRERASSLFVDASLVYSKAISADPKSLAAAFLQAWRPIVRLEQISVELLLKGYQHFLSRPSRGVASAGEAGEAPPRPGEYDATESQISGELKGLLGELSSMGGWVKYWDFIGLRGDRRMRAYLLSYLISRGEVDIRVNAVTGEIWVRAAPRASDEPRTTSLAVVVG